MKFASEPNPVEGRPDGAVTTWLILDSAVGVDLRDGGGAMIAEMRLIRFCFSRLLAASRKRPRDPSKRGKRRSRGSVFRGRNEVIVKRGGPWWCCTRGCLSQSWTDGGGSAQESKGCAWGVRVFSSLDSRSTAFEDLRAKGRELRADIAFDRVCVARTKMCGG